jgi:predicted dehydrogenase
MATVRWGILGTGKIARAFAQALKDTPGAVLAGVASRGIEGARAFAAEFGAGAAYGSYQALADAHDVDIVYIATPHPMHAGNALMALDAGKGVLCEKAFTMNRREAEQVVALARRRKLFLMEAMWSRFMPALAEVRRIIASGEIGPVHHLSADLGFVATQGPQHRLFDPALGGGALLDIGIYPLSIAAALFGPVESVRAHARMGATGVDVQTLFTLRHKGGGMSSCSCSLMARTPSELTVAGARARADAACRSRIDQRGAVTDLAHGADAVHRHGYAHEAIEAQRCYPAGLVESPA